MVYSIDPGFHETIAAGAVPLRRVRSGQEVPSERQVRRGQFPARPDVPHDVQRHRGGDRADAHEPVVGHAHALGQIAAAVRVGLQDDVSHAVAIRVPPRILHRHLGHVVRRLRVRIVVLKDESRDVVVIRVRVGSLDIHRILLVVRGMDSEHWIKLHPTVVSDVGTHPFVLSRSSFPRCSQSTSNARAASFLSRQAACRVRGIHADTG